MTGRLRLTAATLAGFCLAALPAPAAPPQISRITGPSLQPGAAVALIIEGTDLAPNPRIVLPLPIASQAVKDGATPTRVQIDVKLADGAPTGVQQLRLASARGISNPLPVEVDDVALLPFGPQIDKLPAFVQGTLSGAATLSTTVAGKKGQRLVIEAEAKRIGSAIEPVIKLLDPRRVQLAWAQGSTALMGDSRLTAVLPADGTYTIELHDGQYRAGNPNRFRLRVGDFPHADLAFPLAGRQGTKASFELLGLPEPRRVEIDLAGLPGGTFIRLPRVNGLPGLTPRVLVSDVVELLKSEQPKGKLQELPIPCGISGRLNAAGEEDAYRLAVQPGMKLRFDVLAERAGSPLDGVLVLRNETGTQLARSDDQPGTLDPGLEYTVPAGVTALVAAVSDVHARGGPGFTYRLGVTSSTHPDFTLALSEERLQVPRNGAAVLRVHATRTGYDGPIRLTLPGLPATITATGLDIPAGATDTLVSLAAKENVTPGEGAVVRVIGESVDPKLVLKRLAVLPETPQAPLPPLLRALPWLRGEVALGVTEPGPISIAWETLDGKLPIGSNAAAKVKVTRAPEAKGTVRLTLLTSQVVPKTRDNRTDDPTRAIRLDGLPTIPGVLSLAELKIIVPADLPALTYDVAVRAEFLAVDGRTVQFSAVTPVRRLPAAK